MKKAFLSLLLFIPMAIIAAGPQITFIEAEHEFGNIKENNGKVSYDFRYTNTGDAPLVIISATASCGCTAPTFPKQPLAPGDTAVINVKFNPKGQRGEFIKSVIVKSNSEKDQRARLKIKGCVIPANR